MPLFNPDARVQAMELEGGRFCLVIDDALLEPGRVVEHACARREAFQSIDFSKYPGTYLDAPPELAEAFLDCFVSRVRARFDARRCRFTHIRLSMVTLPVGALRPRQWLCHVDDFLLPPTESMPASVLYLFKDELLGGTGFYVRDRPDAEVDAMLDLADTLPPDQFSARTGLQPGYLHASNPFFRRIGGVAPKWNRLIFYDGGMLHAAEIAHPERLASDPATGRLTLNGFFTCRRNLA